MARKNRLNNRMLKNIRREPEYQAVITDLVLLGKLTKQEAARVLGYTVPDFLEIGDVPPNNSSDVSTPSDSGNEDTGDDDSADVTPGAEGDDTPVTEGDE